MNLTQFDYVPDGLLKLDAHDLANVLPGPSLIHLTGKRRHPVFVAILLHGNEDVGWRAFKALMQRYNGHTLPRDLSVFIGNISAAAQNRRRHDDQPDYNRIWPGCDGVQDTNEHQLVRQVVAEMRARNPFVSIDLHNNTGRNPHYACVNKVDQAFLHVASLFSRTVIFFRQPRGVQSMAFAEFCPAVTCECGRVGDERGVMHAMEFIDACLHLNAIPTHPLSTRDVDLYHTVATVKIPNEISFSIGGGVAELMFDHDIDRLNFNEVKAETAFARIQASERRYIQVFGENGEDLYSRFFKTHGNELRFATPLMPSMLTTDEVVIRQDCLCYLMERYAFY